MPKRLSTLRAAGETKGGLSLTPPDSLPAPAERIRQEQSERDAKRLTEDYSRALERYLRTGRKGDLAKVNNLGREVATKGVGVLQLGAVHHEAMLSVILKAFASANTDEEMEEAGKFCTSCPVWLAARGADSSTVSVHDSQYVDKFAKLVVQHRVLRRENSFLRRLNDIREQEARRIAHALHDEAAQLLASVHLAIEECADGVPKAQAARVRRIRKLVDQVERQLRDISHELHPRVLDEFGLADAVRAMTRGVSGRRSIPISVQSTLTGRLPPPIEAALYRVTQEALNNAVKHSRAGNVVVRLSQNDTEVRCRIKDDGRGFDVDKAEKARNQCKLGIAGMRERIALVGGEVRIHSKRKQGTEVVVSVPLGGKDANGDA